MTELTPGRKKWSVRGTPDFTRWSHSFKVVDPTPNSSADESVIFIPEISPAGDTNIQCNVTMETSKPSTSGTVKRRTFELEQSVTDVEVLKQTSFRVSRSSRSSKSSNKLSETVSTIPTDSFTVTLANGEQSMLNNQSFSTLPNDSFKINHNSADLSNLSNKKLSRSFSNVTRRRKLSGEQLNNSFPRLRSSVAAATPKAPVLRTSTPKATRKRPVDTLLKSVLVQNQSYNEGRSLNRTQMNVSKVKVPNFAAIHQKAMDKMEDISQYKQRKEERAEYLLSGTKAAKAAPIEPKQSKRHLTFAPNTTYHEQADDHIPFPVTPGSSQRACPRSPASKFTQTSVELPKIKMALRSAGMNLSPATKRALTPKRRVVTPKKRVVVPNARAATPKVRDASPKARAVAPMKRVSPKKRGVTPKRDGFNRFGFHIGRMPSPKVALVNPFKIADKGNKEGFKAIINKQRVGKNQKENRKELIKGVRSNRRFELLMEMRKNL